MVDGEVFEKINAVIRSTSSREVAERKSQLSGCLAGKYGYEMRAKDAIAYFSDILTMRDIPLNYGTGCALQAIYSQIKPAKKPAKNSRYDHPAHCDCERCKFLAILKNSNFLYSFEQTPLPSTGSLKNDWGMFKDPHQFTTKTVPIKLIIHEEDENVQNINNENEIVSNKDKALNKKRERTTDNEQINEQKPTNIPINSSLEKPKEQLEKKTNEQKPANISNNSSLRIPTIKQINNDGKVLSEENINDKGKPENQI